jgi:hypothetical protein
VRQLRRVPRRPPPPARSRLARPLGINGVFGPCSTSTSRPRRQAPAGGPGAHQVVGQFGAEIVRLVTANAVSAADRVHRRDGAELLAECDACEQILERLRGPPWSRCWRSSPSTFLPPTDVCALRSNRRRPRGGSGEGAGGHLQLCAAATTRRVAGSALTGKLVRVSGDGLKRFDTGKTASSRRTVPLPEFAITALTERLPRAFFGGSTR